MKIEQDKVLHFWVGFAIASVLNEVCISAHLEFAQYSILFLVSAIAIAKETLWDGLLDMGTPELNDVFATVSGAALSTIIYGVVL